MNNFSEADRSRLVGARVRQFRERRGLNKSQLATYAGVSRAYVTRLEAGAYKRSSAAHLGKVAAAMNLSVQDLLTPAADADAEQLTVPRGKAPALRRLLDLDIGPHELWDIVEGVVRMFQRSADEHEQHIFGSHPRGKAERKGC